MSSYGEDQNALLSLLEASTSSLSSVYSSYADFLKPFADHRDKLCSNSSLARSLAKKYVSFLNSSVKILLRRLSDLLKVHQSDKDFVSELFGTYGLCLDCLEGISSQLSTGSLALYKQRVDVVYLLEAFGFYMEAESEGFIVLDKLKSHSICDVKKISSRVVNVVDDNMASLLVRVVVIIVKCVASRRSEDYGSYSAVIELIKESQHWLGLLNSSVYEKLHPCLVTYLGKCSIFIVAELNHISSEIMLEFCLISLNEYLKSPSKYQLYKFARRINSSLFSISNEKPSVAIQMIKFILTFLGLQSKNGMECWEPEFLDTVSYCVLKCLHENTNISDPVADLLDNLSTKIFQNHYLLSAFLKIYSAVLSINGVPLPSTCNVQPDAVDDTVSAFLVANSAKFLNIAIILDSFHSFIVYDRTDTRIPSAVGFNQPHTSSGLPGSNIYLRYYFDALQFICQPITNLVMSWEPEIVIKICDTSASNILCSFREACHEFCLMFLLIRRHEDMMEESDVRSRKIIAIAASVSFTLSMATKSKLQTCMDVIDEIFISGIIDTESLKYISDSLYNLGVCLYKNNCINEASETLEYCCKVSWNYFLSICQHPGNHLNNSILYPSKDVLDLFNDVCTRTSMIFDVLMHSSVGKIKNIMIKSFESWASAEKVLECLPFPIILVKQWAKILYRLSTKEDVSGQTLFSLLSSSTIFSRKVLGNILEQELNVYDEIESTSPQLFKSMQVKVADALLDNVYTHDEEFLKKSIIMIRKAWAVRDGTDDGSKRCVRVLSDAILLMETEICDRDAICNHRLVMAYCLRALSLHEVEPHYQQVVEDIEAAMKRWVKVRNLEPYLFVGDNLFCRNFLMMIYNIIDLLQLKATTNFCNDLLEIVFSILKQNNASLKTCISLFWGSRRLGHALCSSPIDNAILISLSDVYGDLSDSVEFWQKSLDESSISAAGFTHTFLRCAENHKIHHPSTLRKDDIKQFVTLAESNVCESRSSRFTLASTYHVLSEKLIESGNLFQALEFAKEALRLRAKLFEENFVYTLDQEILDNTDGRDHCLKCKSRIRDLKIQRSTAREFWPTSVHPMDPEYFYVSPWKVLQCYLESILQTGIIHEKVGNGTEAETLLLWGKDISYLQNLPLFMIAFSFALGAFYVKKYCWDLAEKEAKNAQDLCLRSGSTVSCLKCKVILEVAVDRQLGNICLSRCERNKGSIKMDEVIGLESLCRLSLERLSDLMWRNSVSCPVVVEVPSFKTTSISTNVLRKVKAEPKISNKRRNASKPYANDSLATANNHVRMTRSRCRLQNHDQNGEVEVTGLNEVANVACITGKSVMLSGSICICNNFGCWLCLERTVYETGRLTDFIHLKWEIIRRRLTRKVLSTIGKCYQIRNQIHEAHEVILQSISVLCYRNSFSYVAPDPLSVFFYFSGKDFCLDVFAVDRAVVLYDICWLVLKCRVNKVAGIFCCGISAIQLPTIVSSLMGALVVCRDIPVLLQKVSTLLSIIFVLSSTSHLEPLNSFCKVLSDSHWASFFHELSVNTNLSSQLFINAHSKGRSRCAISYQEKGEVCNLERLVPDSSINLEKFVKGFFSSLPCSSIICISLVDGEFQAILNTLLKVPSFVHSWILLSLLNSSEDPVVLLLPIKSISDGNLSRTFEESFSLLGIDDKSEQTRWRCPWGSSAVDDVALQFRYILEDSYLNAAATPSEDSSSSRKAWWTRRKELDSQLADLTRKLENSWFGEWKFVLAAADQSYWKSTDSATTTLARSIKSKCKINIGHGLLRLLLAIARQTPNLEACLLQSLSLRNNCVIGKIDDSDEETPPPRPSIHTDPTRKMMASLVSDCAASFPVVESKVSEPLILVLDCDVQMLPWESLPMLRKQEVYRMPSVASIVVAMNDFSHSIDPSNAFFLLNPSGDLSSTQSQFEDLFRHHQIEGKAGMAPSVEELASALRNHDLFIYMGHGSGERYIPCREIEKLERCAGSFLLGCSSGSFVLDGACVPRGAPLAYLLAGSPFIVANLWDVTDLDIDRFARAMLGGVFGERESNLLVCPQCEDDGKKKWPMKGGESCEHRRAVAAFMCDARAACKLPFLTGAAPVCYGLPTTIRRRDRL